MHGKLQQIGLGLSIRSDFKTVTFLHHSRVGAIKPVPLSGLSVSVCVCVCVRARACVCVCARARARVCVCVCVCVSGIGRQNLQAQAGSQWSASSWPGMEVIDTQTEDKYQA